MTQMHTFTTPLRTDDQTGLARFIIIPPATVAALNLSNRTPVRGTINDVPFAGTLGHKTIGTLTHTLMVVRAAWREGVAVGDPLTVTIEVDADRPRHQPPDDLATALDATPAARLAWDRLSPSHKRQHLDSIKEAKKPETRARRIARTVEGLSNGT